MSSSYWKGEKDRLKREIDSTSGSRAESLKAQCYDAERKYKEALSKEAKSKYEKAGWF